MKFPLTLVVALSLALVVDAAEAVDSRDSSEILSRQRRDKRRTKEKGRTKSKNEMVFAIKKEEGKREDDEKKASKKEHPTTYVPAFEGTHPPAARPSKGSKGGSYPEQKTKTSKSGQKMDKLEKKMPKTSRSKNGKGKGKGKGNGGGPPGSNCNSAVAESILDIVPEVITQNPERCCDFDGPTAFFVTHAQRNDETPSGFEPFWNDIYEQIAATAMKSNVCFVMSGYDPSLAGPERTLSQILIDTNILVSQLEDVPAMMSTDPTEIVELIQTIRSISESSTLPSIGVFNAGYNNIIIEAVVSGFERLPYVGYLNDADYGTEAARVSLQLLNGVPARPLCFNARIGELDFIGERCAAYYDEITDETIEPEIGVGCSFNSTVDQILAQIISVQANAVWTHVDCCSVVADAVESARNLGRTIVVGCQDEDTSGGRVDFVTTQPIQLQGYHASSWANFPVIKSLQGRDGRGEQYFPGLQSLVNTAIFNIIIV